MDGEWELVVLTHLRPGNKSNGQTGCANIEGKFCDSGGSMVVFHGERSAVGCF